MSDVASEACVGACVLNGLPLNSKTRREMAVTVALIICGVAPARPPAIMVMYSSKLAVAEKDVR